MARSNIETKNKMKEILYWYDLKGLNPSEKVRFVYMLKGRKKDKGLIESLEGQFLVPGCFLIPKKKKDIIEKTFETWNVRFKQKTIKSK